MILGRYSLETLMTSVRCKNDRFTLGMAHIPADLRSLIVSSLCSLGETPKSMSIFSHPRHPFGDYICVLFKTEKDTYLAFNSIIDVEFSEEWSFGRISDLQNLTFGGFSVREKITVPAGYRCDWGPYNLPNFTLKLSGPIPEKIRIDEHWISFRDEFKEHPVPVEIVDEVGLSCWKFSSTTFF